MSEPLLSLRSLSVSYGPIEAVRDVDIDVHVGDVVALLGANGAGKSSVLRAASGLEDFTGTATFDGRAIRRTPSALARRGLVHVPEGRRVLPTLSVHENLQVATAARGRRSSTTSLDDVYDLFPPLAPLRSRGGWALSGGEQQMLAIGRALVSEPRLLLLDEPSLGLAPTIVRIVFDALRQISSEVPMILVEQNTDVALAVCTRALVMVQGRIEMAGTPEEVGGSADLLAGFLGTSHAVDPGQA